MNEQDLKRAVADFLLSRDEITLKIAARSGIGDWVRAGDEATIRKSSPATLTCGDLICVVLDGDREPRVTEFIGWSGGPEDPFFVRDRMAFSGAALASGSGLLGRVVEVRREGRVIAVPPRAGLADQGLLDPGDFEAKDARLVDRENRVRAGRFFFGLNEELAGGCSDVGDVLITDACPVECTFCLYSCTKAGSKMDPAMVGEIARGYRGAGVGRVRVLGGEPFAHPDHLQDCLSRLRAVWPAERIDIVTSGYWGAADAMVARAMSVIEAAGLKQLIVSIDAFHLDRIAFASYRRVFAACRQQAIDVIANIHYSDEMLSHARALVDMHRETPFTVKLSRLFPVGRAAGLPPERLSFESLPEFAKILRKEGIESQVAAGSCFRWCAVPSGVVFFCCMGLPGKVAGDLRFEPFEAIRARAREAFPRNNRVIAEALLGGRLEGGPFPCGFCPLRLRP